MFLRHQVPKNIITNCFVLLQSPVLIGYIVQVHPVPGSMRFPPHLLWDRQISPCETQITRSCPASGQPGFLISEASKMRLTSVLLSFSSHPRGQFRSSDAEIVLIIITNSQLIITNSQQQNTVIFLGLFCLYLSQRWKRADPSRSRQTTEHPPLLSRIRSPFYVRPLRPTFQLNADNERSNGYKEYRARPWIKLIAQKSEGYGSAGISQIDLQDKNEVMKDISNGTNRKTITGLINNQKAWLVLPFAICDLRFTASKASVVGTTS